MANNKREEDFNILFRDYKFCLVINMKNKEEWLSSNSDYYMESSSWHYETGDYYYGEFVILENAAIIRFMWPENLYEKNINIYLDKGFNPLNADFIRKVCILHAFYFKKGLDIEYIGVDADGKTVELDKGRVFSMIKGELNIGSGWYNKDTDSERIIKPEVRHYIDKSKSDVSNRLYSVAMYNFLIGLGRKNIYDKFINYWSSINAYYNFMIKLYNNKVKREFINLKGYINEDYLPKEKNIEKICIDVADRNGLAMLYYMYFYSGNIEYKETTFAEICKLYIEGDNNITPAGKYKRFDEEYINKNFIEKYLSDNKIDNNISDENKRQLVDYILTIFLPCKLRNRFIHGNETVPIVVSDISWEYEVLKKLSDKMEEFLNKVLPKSFPDDNNIVYFSRYDTKMLFDKVYTKQSIVGNDQKKCLNARNDVSEKIDNMLIDNNDILNDSEMIRYFYEWWPTSDQRKNLEKSVKKMGENKENKEDN